ncbi:MAG TPA: hypothetical protein VMB82_06915 [Acidimicrobiales bacterium]|nr:hypothetical protein [Acidimicrobiales bacterium]
MNRIRLSPKQVAASATGAVLAALIASFFGEKGTLVGIALGSIVATTATALVMQSLERTHQAVQQAVQSSDRTSLLRRLGSSRPVGSVAEATEPSPVARDAPRSSLGGEAGGVSADDSVVAGAHADAGAAGSEGDRRLVASARSGGPGSTPSVSSTRGVGTATDRRRDERRRISWRVLATSVGLVFVVALLAVTALELAVGKPLASWVGSSQSNGGTTLSNLGSSPTTTTLPPATTAPTSTSTTASTTTSTVVPASTTTTGVASSSTTTSTSTTTTTTTTTQPSPSPGGAGGG